MTSKQFTLRTLLSIVLFVLLFSGVHLLLNDFGLFYEKEELRIWTRPKTSKHLFSYRYIPENFRGLLIGASVSTNVDTRKLNGHKIYNLSMEGANTTELEICATKALERGEMETLIISLSPYMLKNSGIKGSEIGPQEYWGSIFSLLPIKVFVAKVRTAFKDEAKDPYKYSQWGHTDINVHAHVDDFLHQVETFRVNPAVKITINDQAFHALENIITLAREKNVQIVAYFHPLYYLRYEEYVHNNSWYQFKARVSGLFTSEDILWDMNTRDYDYLRKEVHYYTSMEHLSQEGADILAGVIEEQLCPKE